MERRTFLKLAALVPGLALAGCGGSKTLLSPKDPTMLSIWHVYGEQADSPMNRLLTEFNDTVGREKGILLNVTNMTNSAAIGGQLQDAKAGKPGALDLPDLFSAHPRTQAVWALRTLWTGTTGSPPRTWRPMCPALCRTASLTGGRWCSRCPNPPSSSF